MSGSRRILDRAQLKPVRGAGGGGKGGSPSDSPNTLQSDSIASIVLLMSEGECEGLADGLKDVYFSFTGKASDAVPVQNSDGSYNFNGVNAIFTPGTPDQDPLPGFPQVQTVVNVNQQLLHTTPYIAEITDPDADSVIVTLQFDGLYFVDSGGNVLPSSVLFEIDVQPNGGSYAEVVSFLVSGKTSSTYQKSIQIPLTGSAPWNVKIIRQSIDTVTVNDVSASYVAFYTINQDYALIYPDSCLLGLQVDARLFGTQIPTVFVKLKRVKWQCPANYDPVARTYATSGPGTTGGVWDGTFQTAWTNNAAWVLYGLITNPRYGLGQYVDTALVDKFSLYAIAQYCDALVPDGAGGTEPRYVFNGTIASKEDALKALQTIASTFRGMVFWGSQGAMVTADMPADPVKLVTPANVTDGMITYSGTGQKAIHTVCLVDWANPALNFEKDTQVVETPNLDDIARYGWREIGIAAAGCTSRGQANRMGRWLLYSERLQAETATWTASWDEADFKPGDYVSVADPAYAGARFGGRLISTASDKKSVVIDAAVTIAVDESYTFLVMLPDGTIGEATITNSPGSTATLTFSAALSDTPVAGAIWQINSTALEPRQFTCIINKESSKHLFAITALLHDPDIYDLVELNIMLEAATFTALPGGGLPAPSNLSVLQGLDLISGVSQQQPVAIFSWTPPADARISEYEAQMFSSGSWGPSSFTTGSSVDFPSIAGGTYDFRVRSVGIATAGATTLTSAWEELDSVTLVPSTVLVSDGSVTESSLDSALTAAFSMIPVAAASAAAAIANLSTIPSSLILSQPQFLSTPYDRSEAGFDATMLALLQTQGVQDSFSSLESSTANSIATINQALIAFATDTGALAELINILNAQTGNNIASIQSTLLTQATTNSAVAAEITTLTASVGSNSGSIATIDTTLAAQATTNSATASTLSTLTTDVSGNTASISTLTTSVNGISVQYTITGTINGMTGTFTFEGVEKADGSVSYTALIDGGLVVSGTITSAALVTGIINVGTLIANNIIDSGHLITDTATEIATASGSSGTLVIASSTSPGTYTTSALATLTYTAVTGNLIVTASFDCSISIGTVAVGEFKIFIQIYLDGSLVRSSEIAPIALSTSGGGTFVTGGEYATANVTELIQTTAGSHTITIKGAYLSTVTGGPWTYTFINNTIVLLESIR